MSYDHKKAKRRYERSAKGKAAIRRYQTSAKGKAKFWKAHLKHKYGLTEDQYADLVTKHGGQCAICGMVKTLCVDHDHDTNLVRGLLCHECNKALGHFRDDPSVLRRAAIYLEAAL